MKKPKDVIPEPNRLLYPREKIQIGWKSSGRKWQVGSGMINMGNTCYLNSTLQALFHVPSFANWLYSDQIHRDRCADTGKLKRVILEKKFEILNQNIFPKVLEQVV